MLFNSIEFAIFLPVVFAIYWWLGSKNWKFQNLLILVASYTFYGWWDWRFLLLILLSTLVDYFVGIDLAGSENDKRRRLLLGISLATNLGLLCFFKYFNFFLENFVSAFTFFGGSINANSLHIILPIGISFYTFQSLSYTIDIYRHKLTPTRDFIAFSSFISFFPQLVAGPIERAKNLLPQFLGKRTFDYTKAVDGLRQMLWGLFKKVVIADNCAMFADWTFNNPESHSSSTLIVGVLFFTLQIYADFSGYSDIAIGTAKLFGLNLSRNFAFPYFSRDIAEFWRRWHISLTSWFRDYIYIPMGGSRGGSLQQIRNVLIIFLVSGFWHGANWTFLIWGLLNAIYFLPMLLANKHRRNLDTVAAESSLPTLKELFFILVTFGLTAFAWIFFRAESLTDALIYISGIFSSSPFSIPLIPEMRTALVTIGLIVILVLLEWQGRKDEYAIEKLGLTWPKPLRWGTYLLLAITILVFMKEPSAFIYFQF